MSALQENAPQASASTLASNMEGPAIGADKEAKKSRNSTKDGAAAGGGLSQESDSFNRHYNKEIKVNQEEIPIVLYELLDAAFNYIQRESYEKAIILLQKTEGVLDVVTLDQSKRDRYIIYCTFHNMALCYQKLGMLEECYVYLKECQKMIALPSFYKDNSVTTRMKQLKQECKIKLQLCAILSQTQNHTEALDNSKKSVKLVHQLFKDLFTLCGIYIKKIESRDHKLRRVLQTMNNLNKPNNSSEGNGEQQIQGQSERQQISILSTSPSQFQVNQGAFQIQNGAGNFLEDSISMLERTSLKLYPILREVVSRLIEESPQVEQKNEKLASEIEYEKILLPDDADMRSVLGFLNQNEWIYNLNIGNIMQIQPISMKELLSSSRNETELSRDSFLEKLSLLSVAYFCVSTEMRFILQSRVEFLTSPVKKKKELESEYWHAKALEIACTFLPSECPLLNHILLSYQKHHDPSHQPIKEDQEQTDILDVIRPLKGIESNKYQPIVRQIQNLKVAISPCQMSPLTRRIFKSSGQQNVTQVTTDKKSLPHSTKNLKGHARSTEENIDIQGLINAAAISEIKDDEGHNLDSNQRERNVNEEEMIEENSAEGQLQAVSNQEGQSNRARAINLYSEEYYDLMVKQLVDDPKLDKKQLVHKLLSKIQSEDYSSFAHIMSQHDLEREEDGGNLEGYEDGLGAENSMSKSFDMNHHHTLQSHKEVENPDESSSLHQLWTENQNQRKSVQSNLGARSKLEGVSKSSSSIAAKPQRPFSSQERQQKKRKDLPHSKKKLMSYLEGDSLLKEIEKSLEREGAELEFQDDEDEDDDEFEDHDQDLEDEDNDNEDDHNNDHDRSDLFNKQRNIQNMRELEEFQSEAVDPDKLSGTSLHHHEANKSSILDDISTEGMKQLEKLSSGVNPLHMSSSESKGNKTNSNFKSKSFTRPSSSSFTNQTTASQLRRGKRYPNPKNGSQAQKNETIKTGATPQPFNSSSNMNKQRQNAQVIKSLEFPRGTNYKNKHLRNFSSSDKSHSSEKIFSHPVINNFLKQKKQSQINQVNHMKPTSHSNDHIKKNAKIIKQRLQAGDPKRQRSASRVSNPGSKGISTQIKDGKRQQPIQNTREVRQEGEGNKRVQRKSRSSSTEKNYPKSEGKRKDTKSRDKLSDISFFKNLHKEPPLLTQPSEHINHNHSFDIALPSSQKNISSSAVGIPGGENQSLHELQKRVLENQRQLLMFSKQYNNSDSKKPQKQQKKRSYGNLRQTDLNNQLSQFQNPNNQSVIVENSLSKKPQQKRGKSNNFLSQGASQAMNSSMLHGGKSLLHQKSIDHSGGSNLQNAQDFSTSKVANVTNPNLRQDLIETLLQNNEKLLKQAKSSNLKSQIYYQQLDKQMKGFKSGNKENINSSTQAGTTQLDQTKILAQKYGSLNKRQKKRSVNPTQTLNYQSESHKKGSGSQAQQHSQSFVLEKNRLGRDVEQLKNKSRGQFGFFDNHSPQLKKRRQGGSHSPPKKIHNQSISQHNRSIKVEGNVAIHHGSGPQQILSGLRASNLKQNRGVKVGANGQMQQIFATTDSRRPLSKKRVSNLESVPQNDASLAALQQYMTQQHEPTLAVNNSILNDDSIMHIQHEQSFENFLKANQLQQKLQGSKVHHSNISNLMNPLSNNSSFFNQQPRQIKTSIDKSTQQAIRSKNQQQILGSMHYSIPNKTQSQHYKSSNQGKVINQSIVSLSNLTNLGGSSANQSFINQPPQKLQHSSLSTLTPGQARNRAVQQPQNQGEELKDQNNESMVLFHLDSSPILEERGHRDGLGSANQSFGAIFGSGIHRGSSDVMLLNTSAIQNSRKETQNQSQQQFPPSSQLVSSDISHFQQHHPLHHQSMEMPFEIASSSFTNKIVPLRNRNTSKVFKSQIAQIKPAGKNKSTSNSLAPNRQSHDQLNKKLQNLRA